MLDRSQMKLQTTSACASKPMPGECFTDEQLCTRWYRFSIVMHICIAHKDNGSLIACSPCRFVKSEKETIHVGRDTNPAQSIMR
jgi:hypothetical protein